MNIHENHIAIATKNGLLLGERDDLSSLNRILEPHHITCVAGKDRMIYAGSHDGLFCSDDRGKNWTECTPEPGYEHIRSIKIIDNQQERILLGTEPAMVFYSTDHGKQWHPSHEVARLRDRYEWSLPYSPRKGCIRDFSQLGDIIFSAAEQGGVLRSADHGFTWQMVGGYTDPRGAQEGTIHNDVHRVYTLKNLINLVWSCTGGGFFYSENQGNSWNRLYDAYCRAVWIDIENPDHMILGSAQGPDRMGEIVETKDGNTWQSVNDGSGAPWEKSMVEKFVRGNENIYMILSDGRVFSSDKKNIKWQQIWPEIDNVVDIYFF
jgi:photosystem II stability/assembly factor-like uncharacterized protein